MKYEVGVGENIYFAAQNATKLAVKCGEVVWFKFNEVKLETSPQSNPNDICIIYSLKCQLTRAGR